MSQPLVSVHVIIYNMIDYIEETLTSALEQSYDNLEVVASDDGSTDGTPDVIRDYARRYPGRLVPLVGGPNLGHTGNCNRALSACRGKYIAFQGGDDVFLPGKIQAQVAWMEADPQRVLCYHDYEAFENATGKRLYLGSDAHALQSGHGAGVTVRKGVLWGGTTVMVRRDAMPAHGFDTHIKIVSDWICWIECLADGGQYGYVDGLLARYRRHDNNISKSGLQTLHDDQFATLALVEARYPWLVPDVRVGRARLYRSLGMAHRRQGRLREARAYWRTSLRHEWHWKGAAPWMSTYLPTRVSDRLIRVLAPPFTY